MAGLFIVVDNSFGQDTKRDVSSSQMNRVDRACPSTKEDPARVARRSLPQSDFSPVQPPNPTGRSRNSA